MSGNSEFITKIVNDGTYFVMAREWYQDMFLRPVRAAALMTALGISFISLTTVILYNLYNIFPISKQVDVVVFLNDTINFYAQLTNISEENKSTKQVVTEYLCAKYIKAREGYSSKNYVANYYFVSNCSSKEVFNKYFDTIDTKNPESPLVIYKNTGRVDVEILSCTMNDHDIIIIFNKKNYGTDGNLVSQSKLQATMKIYLSNYDWSKSTNTKLDFIVTQYDVKNLTA